MPDPITIKQAVNDPRFSTLSSEGQKRLLSKIDPRVGELSDITKLVQQAQTGLRMPKRGAPLQGKKGVGAIGRTPFPTIGRSPTKLETARRYLHAFPRIAGEFIGGAVGGTAGATATGGPIGAYAGGVAGAGAGGAAGEAYSDAVRRIPNDLAFLRGTLASGSVLGGMLDVAATSTAPNLLYSPPRVRERARPLTERMGEAAIEGAASEATGRVFAGVGGAAVQALKGAPTSKLGEAGQLAVERDIPMLPTAARGSKFDVVLQEIAGTGGGGRKALSKIPQEASERATKLLEQQLDQIGPKTSPEVAGKAAKDAFEAQSKRLSEEGRELYDRARELIQSKRVTKFEEEFSSQPTGLFDAKGAPITKQISKKVPVETIEGGAVDLRPLKKMFKKEVIDAQKGVLPVARALGEESKLLNFAEAMQQADDFVPYGEAQAFRSQVLSAVRGSVTGNQKRLDHMAVEYINEEMERVAGIGGDEAVRLTKQANTLWRAKNDLFERSGVPRLAKLNPEFVARNVWRADNVTMARDAMRAAGGFNSPAWRKIRRQGFENIFKSARAGRNLEGSVAKWWDNLGPEMQQMIAGPNQREIGKIMTIMREGEFTKVARQLRESSGTFQFAERTVLARLGYITGGAGVGLAAGGPVVGLAGGLLILGAPRAAAKLLTNKRGVGLFLEGVTNKVRPVDVGVFFARAASVVDSIDEETGKIRRTIEPIPTPMLGGR